VIGLPGGATRRNLRGTTRELCQGDRRARCHARPLVGLLPVGLLPVGPLPVNAVAAGVAAVLGAGTGSLVARLAGSFPWDGGPLLRTAAVRPPVGEVLGAALGVLVVLRFGVSAQLAAWVWFAAAGLLLALIDPRTQLLPNRVLLPATAGTAALLLAAAAGTGDWSALLRAVEAGAASFAVGLVMALLAPAGLGMGDVKLAALLGLVLGWLAWPLVLDGFLLGFVLQAVAGLLLLAARRAGRRTELPFGPALLAGALVVALLAGG
jgi:leader peptidase (prepilin peptidase)/N-methyltransferase